jgi:hypothetical protein
MAMVCPRCQQAFEQQLHCRDCGCRLQFQADNLDRTPLPAAEPTGPWQHTPWGKIVVGVLLAVGLSYGLQQLCTAWLVAGIGSGAPGLWATLWGLAILHALQALSLIVGGGITGAGQPRGILYGSVVGLVSGAVFLALQRHQGDGQPDLMLFSQPLLHAIFGMLGGRLGMLIWKPPPVIALSTNVPADPQRTEGTFSRLFRGPVHPGRVFTGVFIVVAGVVWSSVILDYVLRASNGMMAISSTLQARLIGWEIAALATLLGAGVAGATTFNGLKQGLFVGLGSIVMIAGIYAGNDKLILDSVVAMIGTVFGLSLAGGWFGGQLFPPVIRVRRRPLSQLS